MKILPALVFIVILSITLDASMVLGENKEKETTPPDGPSKDSAVSQDVGFHTLAIDEATAFLRNQIKKNLVPGLKASDRIVDGGLHYLENAMFMGTREKLQNILFHLSIQQSADKSVYSYSLARPQASKDWKIIDAWRTHPSGYREILSVELKPANPSSLGDDWVTPPESASGEASNATPISLKKTSDYETSLPEFEKVRQIANQMHSENQLPGIRKETEFTFYINPRAIHEELRERRPIQFIPLSLITEEEDGWFQYLFVPDASEEEWIMSSAWHFSADGILSNLANGPEPAKQNRAVAVINGHAILESELAKVALQQTDEPKNIPRKVHLDQLITTELIVQDFKKRDGVIRDEILDQDQASFVKGVFRGNESDFLQEIFKSGYNISQFRIMRERKIIDTYMRNFMRKSPEAEFANDTVETWIAKLRADAKIEIYELQSPP